MASRSARLKVLTESRARAADAVSFLRADGAKSQPQWRKLRGFFTLLGTIAHTESSPSVSRSTPKNKYLFFIKNKVSEVREMCLSERDKAQLSALSPQTREALTEILASGDANRHMPAARDQVVTVRQFLNSALGDNSHICDDLENPGLLRPQAEPERAHRKAPIARIVIELRDVSSVGTLQEVFDIMSAATRDAPKINSTTYLEKMPVDLDPLDG